MKIKIVFVGRLDNDQGLPILLDVFWKLKEEDNRFQIEFCGDGELKSECERYGAVHGFINDVDKYLRNAQYCFTGGYLSILDGLRNGCVVVCAYQNELKRDYYELSVFKDYIIYGGSALGVCKQIMGLSDKEKSEMVKKGKKLEKELDWGYVKNEYYKLWGIGVE